jgi:FkbH-like protein
MSAATGQTAALLQSLRERPTALAIAKALRELEREPAGVFAPFRLAVAASFTFDPLIAPLRARAYCDGLRLSVENGPYGQFRQALLDPAWPPGEAAGAVLLAIRLADAVPMLYDDFNALVPGEVDRLAGAWQDEFTRLLESFRTRSAARLLIANYEQPVFPNLGYADASAERGQAACIAGLNDWLREAARRVGNAFVLDVDGLAARVGRNAFCDPRLDLLARCPIAADHHWTYAGEVLRVVRMLTGRVRKVLALDCDNTLWGGVLGDVGRDGVQLGHDFPGSAYRALQRRALELQRRGVVLVIASKNEHASVLDVFTHHPEMILRPEHISYFAVNWDPKPQNLRQAAERLSLGLDSFVFVDDHAVECAMMREMLPQVLTVQLPEEPALYERTLAALDVFDQPVISGEDRSRGRMYREEAARAELRAGAGDLESFFRGLQMRLVILSNDPRGLARAAQLTQRTNQFNMTTLRRSEDELHALTRDEAAELVTLRLIDRFGDNGVVGLAITRLRGEQCELDTFLMSCRVLGRTVEGAFLTWLARRARQRGAVRLSARYVPTSKNRPFGGFYREWGMTRQEVDASGGETWTFDLTRDAPQLQMPDWFELQTVAGDSSAAAETDE